MQLFSYIAIVDDDTSAQVALARLLSVHKIDCQTYSSARAFSGSPFRLPCQSAS
jgi:FixJ family two-component response regulator